MTHNMHHLPGPNGGNGNNGVNGSSGANGFSMPWDDAESSTPQRGLYDYWAMFRERLWGFIAIFLIVLAGSILYTVTVTPEYKGRSTLRFLREDPDVLPTGHSLDLQEIHNVDDFNSQIEVFQSNSIISSVSERLKGDTLDRFMEPYEKRFKFLGPITPLDVLWMKREILPVRQSLIVSVEYKHPDSELAATIANYFAEEFIARNLNLLIESSMDAVDQLRLRVDQQRAEIEQIEKKLAEYKKDTGIISFDDKADIDHMEFVQLHSELTKMKLLLDAARTNWSAAEKKQEEGGPLWEIAYIANMLQVSELLSERAALKIQIATLRERYRDGHPKMIAVVQSYYQTEAELKDAVDSAVLKVKNDYDNAQSNYEKILERVNKKQKEILELAEKRIPYDSMLRQREVAEVTYQGMLQRMNIEAAKLNMKKANILVVDKAFPARDPDTPNIPLNIALGFIGGGGLAIMYVFAFGILDERVKTSTMVESHLKLPLLSIIPKTVKMDSFQRARVSASNADRRAAEAFRTVYSNLRVQEANEFAQVVMITSTVPSEGKSFAATNLAITCASHGEKTLLIDADLRVPAVAQSLGIEQQVNDSGGGLTGYFSGNAAWEDLVLEDVFPGLDVLGSTRRIGNPSEIVNSSEFSEIVNFFRDGYDRIILDTPPLGVVSDALSISPLCNGCIYVIKHNYVKIRQIRSNIRRLKEAATPVLGALMNNVGRSGTAYYNSNYYSYNYARYYTDTKVPGEDDPVLTPRHTSVKVDQPDQVDRVS